MLTCGQEYQRPIFSFVWVKVAGKSAHIEAYALDGSVLDRFDLNP